jgi:uncharacterized protein YjaG (DUF416 family)
MRKFDESRLVVDLDRLHIPLRVAFAAACAERQMPAYRLFEAQAGRVAPNALESALEEMWTEPSRTKNAIDLEHQIEAGMALIPQEDCIEGPWTQEATNAQNAGMAVVYALRTKLTGEAQEAAWAARVAYEALDNFVINKDNIDTNRPGEELRVLSHPIVQAEFARQERDLRDLLAASGREFAEVVKRVRNRAMADATVFFGPVS